MSCPMHSNRTVADSIYGVLPTGDLGERIDGICGEEAVEITKALRSVFFTPMPHNFVQVCPQKTEFVSSRWGSLSRRMKDQLCRC